MGDSLFSVLFSTIRSRFAAIVSRIKLWTSWSFIRTKIIGGIRDFFFKVLDVRPKNKNDYYSVFGWMISKRLAYAIIIIVGVLSIWYISSTTKLFQHFTENGGVRTYAYDSIMLRLAKNRVRITGKGGYLAFEGDVSKGYATGNGELYSPQGITLYTGGFEKNKYEGTGYQYYPSGTLKYTGSFHNNLYEGTGKLYRENGTLEYEGDFSKGLREGKGRLCDAGGNVIYDGSFQGDSIVYSELLGKGAEELSDIYLGSQVLYEDGANEGTQIVVLPDIHALYLAESDGDASEDAPSINAVYVLADSFRSGDVLAEGIEGLPAIFGDPVSEGNSTVSLPEAVAINVLNESDYAVKGRVSMDTTAVFSDDIVVNNFDRTYSVYVYTYRRGGLVYTFVCREKGGGFFFYEIENAGSDEEE